MKRIAVNLAVVMVVWAYPWDWLLAGGPLDSVPEGWAVVAWYATLGVVSGANVAVAMVRYCADLRPTELERWAGPQ